ncbi:MAG TPA: DUF1800 family protein [Solirubrobacteraceae bacterium]|jgi:uncharacterized protein (DUF1800 family)|nr:DUF1800 family protein [Solirubrobacteraceae bacterium]
MSKHATKPVAKRGGRITSETAMTEAMVDRLFWRAGFGPSDTDRKRWTGKTLGSAVDWLLNTPAGYSGSPGTDQGKPLDPTGNDSDLVLSWVDQMNRAINPFVERMTFFWHGHWANSRESVSPPQLLMTQTKLFRKYADFASNPKANFHDMAYAVTIDPSMLRYLTGELNVRGAPNENYARELMELFTLGVTNAAGKPNYTQTDVEQLAKAFSGWQINDKNPNAVSSYFTQSRWYDGPKLVFGKFENLTSADAVKLVLSRPAHPGFIINALWSNFIVKPPSAAKLKSLERLYLKSGMRLKPLIQAILTEPELFASLDEPNMVKPPIVYVVGAMRAMKLQVKDTTASDFLDAMGQLPYFPPTVAGWQGGITWLNTDTALARFSFITTLLEQTKIKDVAGETAAQAYSRAYTAVGSPWLAPDTQREIKRYAARAQHATPELRINRQIAVRALILAGPDAQVI